MTPRFKLNNRRILNLNYGNYYGRDMANRLETLISDWERRRYHTVKRVGYETRMAVTGYLKVMKELNQ